MGCAVTMTPLPLADLIPRLPELYQPLYGHEDLSPEPRRHCLDRLKMITDVSCALQQHLNRPLRVLDLGCAQGFFSFYLAAQGASVLGIDHESRNIDVCEVLRLEHPDYEISFRKDNVSDVIETLEKDSFDLVLGLSVFHHVAHEKGTEYVQGLLRRLSSKTQAQLLEFALREEPVYWSVSLPADERSWLVDSPFVMPMGRFETHLSAVKRPLFYASNRTAYLGGKIYAFSSWMPRAHERENGYHQESRRYFFSDKEVIKLLQLDGPRGEFNRCEWEAEQKFLSHCPADVPGVPPLLGFGVEEMTGWIVEGRLAGERLSVLMAESRPYDTPVILLDILDQLVALERHGYFHNDVRPWNVLVSADGPARLIDFGSITREAKACIRPFNVFANFFIFAFQIIQRQLPQDLLRQPFVVPPLDFPAPYDRWLLDVWARWETPVTFQSTQKSLKNALAFPWGFLNKFPTTWGWFKGIAGILLRIRSAVAWVIFQRDSLRNLSLYAKESYEELLVQWEEADQDRMARLKEIHHLGNLLGQVEEDRAERLKVIDQLFQKLNASEKSLMDISQQLADVDRDRVLRLKELERTGALLSQVDADRNARLRVIEALSARLERLDKALLETNQRLSWTEKDRLARLRDTEKLTALFKGADEDRKARLKTIDDLSHRLIISQQSLANTSAQLVAADRDRQERLGIIEELNRRLAEAEADRAARWTSIVRLTEEIERLRSEKSADSGWGRRLR